MQKTSAFVFLSLIACGSPSVGAVESQASAATLSAASTKLQPTPIGTPVLDVSAYTRLERAAVSLETLSRIKKPALNAGLSARFLPRGAKPIAVVGSGEEFSTGEWDVDRDLSIGRIFARRPSSPGVKPSSERAILDAASKELAALGIDAGERTLLYREVMGQDQSDDGKIEEPKLFSHKVFAFRTIEGIRVATHRLVLGFDDENTLTRAIGRWPTLSEKGHKLRTRLTTNEVSARATVALGRAGIANRAAPVRFEYVPQAQADGSVTLELNAVATFVPEDSEPRNVRIPVDAF